MMLTGMGVSDLSRAGNERTLNVVRLEKQQKNERRNFEPPRRQRPQNQHGNEYRCLHYYPACAVRYGFAPLFADEDAVSCAYFEQNEKYDDGNS